MPYRVIDLFAGAGGFTEGFKEHLDAEGQPLFVSVWANDFNLPSVNTYNSNFGNHCVHGDIAEILEAGVEIPNADIVIGGPPCQGFSLLNKQRITDPRRQMWRHYMEVVQLSGADIFIMENVAELLKSAEYNEIKVEAERQGFRVVSDKLKAVYYGVPQARQRTFIIGARLREDQIRTFFPPLKTHFNPEKAEEVSNAPHTFIQNPLPWETVRHAIGNLPDPEGTEIRKTEPPLNLHFGRNPTDLSLRRYAAIPEEGMNRFDLQRVAPEITPPCWIRKKTGGTDLFGRLWWDRPSVTIRTEFFKPEKGRYLHPVQNRPITHREAARIQTFPDGFRFVGNKTEIAKQIGNAVPPRLAFHVASVALSLLNLLEQHGPLQQQEENILIEVSAGNG